ncbi:pyruvate dehydrogenase [bacterium]|nr:pyruvate dehydrogenase [bacterium]
MAKNPWKLTNAPKLPKTEVLESIMTRAHSHVMSMIHIANHRKDKEKGDPKVGGHPAACASSLHLLSTLHLAVRNPQDFMAVKPHASPVDHANNYLLRLFWEGDNTKTFDWMKDDRMKLAMKNLRHFTHSGEPVFQSYHSTVDPDHWNVLPSGSVGIPPVNAIYLAHAYRMAEKHGYNVPQDAHFWCLMGDSEFREGSLSEVMPEAAERNLGNVTWILDYNRQSLDGHRVLNEEGLGSKDNDRVEDMMRANGWDVIQLRHGSFREKVFAQKDGEALRSVFEEALPDFEFQAMLAGQNAKQIKDAVGRYDKAAQKVLSGLKDEEVVKFINDLGGHDVEKLIEVFNASKEDPEKPTMIIAHTLKGWKLTSQAKSANHNTMIEEDEVIAIRNGLGLKGEDYFNFEHFDAGTPEAKYLAERGEWLRKGMQAQQELKAQNLEATRKKVIDSKALENFPTELGINLKFVPLIHTQWMIGQLSAKLTRIAETPLDEKDLKEGQKALSDDERKLKVLADGFITMAPDVGTSTNLNSTLDGRIFGPETEDFEGQYGVQDSKTPHLVPHENSTSRFIRFDIAESNTMSCVGSYGMMPHYTGNPILPMMTVYDFFIKRALDQYFYNAYWKSSFICVGTPAGVTLSPEGAQHGWKSDIQIANSITWEPAYCQELDWIYAESIKRHLFTLVEGEKSPNGNAGRSAVLIRCVTRALEQKEMLKRLKTHKRFEGKSDADILESTRKDCLEGGYYLVDHRGKDGYRPSENVVNLFTMGALVTEALQASDKLLEEGIFANVIQVSSPDLLLGNLAEQNNYKHLKQGLGITGDLFTRVTANAESAAKASMNGTYPPQHIGPRPFDTLTASHAGAAQLMTLAGRRIPIVSVHDGEPGILDNIGSCVGTLHKSLATRKHSKCGRPSDIYAYHGMDPDTIVASVHSVMEESALSEIRIEAPLAQAMSQGTARV